MAALHSRLLSVCERDSVLNVKGEVSALIKTKLSVCYSLLYCMSQERSLRTKADN